MGRLGFLCSFFLFTSLVLAGCGGLSQSAPEGKSSNPIKVAIQLPSGVSMLSGGRVKSTNPRIAATTITAITLDVTGEGMESVSAAVPIPSAGSTVAEVVVDVTFGLARLFKVTISTSTGYVFRGETSLDIDASKTVLNTATGELEVSVTIDVNIDMYAPAAPAIDPLTTPTNINSFTISGTAETDSTVTVFDGTVSIGSAAAGGGTWSIPSGTLADGTTHSFTATATDGFGNISTASAAVTVTVDLTPPTAPTINVVTSPSNNATPTITGTADSGTTVVLLDGGVSIGTATASGGIWSITLVTAFTTGSHTLTATSTDSATNSTGTVSPTTLVIDVTPPAAPAIDPLTTPTNINLFTISGTAEADSTVTVFDGTAVLGTAPAGSGGIWSIPSGTFADGTTHSFTATAMDSFGNISAASAAVTVTVISNVAPVAVNDTAATAEDTVVTTGNVLANDTDANGDTLSISTADTATASGGTVTNNNNGTFTYTPALNFNGTDTFTYTVSDGKGGTAVGTVTITVAAVNDAPTVAVNTGLTLNANATATPVTGTMLQATDVDNTAAQLTYTVTVIPTEGTLKNGATTLIATGTFTQADIDAGNISYTPTAGRTGADSFTFTLSDGAGGTVAPTQFNITTEGLFSLAVNFAAGTNPTSVTSADFNGDGNADMAVANVNSGNVSVLLGDGLGGFATAVHFAAGAWPQSVTSADFNGDGKMDLAVANSNGVSVLLGDGAGGFSAAVNFAAGSTPFSVISADFNGDGKMDLAVANADFGGSGGNVSVLLGDGLGGFATAVNFTAGTQPASVTSADFNGDGKMDMAVANFGGAVSVLLGDGAGGFSSVANFAAGTNPSSVTSADFNGDGKVDLAVANSSGVSVLLGNGLGGFASAGSFAAGTGPFSVTSADFNGDGNADMAVANRGTFNPTTHLYSGGNVSVLLGDGTGGFATAVNYAAGSSPVSVTSAGFNGDGSVDIAVANWSSNNVSVLLNRTTVANVPPVFTGSPAIAQTTAGVDTRLTVSGIGTLDANGNAVSLSYQWQANGVNIAGATAPAYTVQAADFGKTITAVITANDGTRLANATTTATTAAVTVTAIPVVVTNTGTGIVFGTTATITITNAMLNTTDVNHTAAQLIYTLTAIPAQGTLKNGATTLSVNSTFSQADIDSGSISYTPAANQTVADSFTFTLSDGTGGTITATRFKIAVNFFATAVSYAAGTQPGSVTSADFNGDGKMDMAVANFGTWPDLTDSNVSVLLGDGLGGFATVVNFAAGKGSISVTSADFNGDGNADLAVANMGAWPNFDSNVSILLGDGAGGFSAPVNFAAGTATQSVTSADFNGDGNADMAVANSGTWPNFTDSNVSVLLGDGLGGFSSAVNFASGTSPRSVTTADFDGDGKADMAVANSSGVSVLLGDGLGGFSSAVNFAAGTATQSVTSADFNGDGNADMAVANFGTWPNYTDSSVSVLLGDGLGGFSSAVNFAAGTQLHSVTSADFNGDGKADMAVANSSGVSVLLGDGAGGFATAMNFAAGSLPGSITSADFDGDGSVDMAVTNSGGVGVLLNQTTVNPAANTAPLFTGSPAIAPTAPVIGTRLTVTGTGIRDANGNAVTLSYQWQANGVDIAGATAPAYTTRAADSGKAVTVVITADDGTHVANATTSASTTAVTVGSDFAPVPAANTGLAVGIGSPATVITNAMLNTTDADNTTAQLIYTLTAIPVRGVLKNGAATLSLNSTFTQADIDAGNISYTPPANQIGTDGFSFTISDGAGGTITATTFRITVQFFASAVNFAAGGQPASVTSADFNGDGNADMAVTDQTSDNVSVFLGDGAGGFATAVNFAVGSFPTGVTSADFNGDGKADMAVANQASGNVSVLLGDGLGGFASAVNFAAGTWPLSVTSADFNGDGKVDLAVASEISNSVSVLLGNGLGGFATAVNFAAGTGPFSVTSADFNGDGNADLAVANAGNWQRNFTGGSVSILLGDGAGGFSAAVNFAAGAKPQSVTSADFNGDGKVDLAVANFNSNNVSVLLGDGLGGFATAVNFAAGTNPESVTSADFNGDGKVDLAVANQSSNNISVLLGDGAGGFSAALNFAAGTRLHSVMSADFNGDGNADLAVVNNQGGGNTIVLLNQTTVNPATNTAPLFTGTPAIVQTAPVTGTQLTITGIGASDANGNSVTLSYQWQVNGVNIAGATAPAYIVQAGDVGKAITVVITANDGTQTANATVTSPAAAVTILNTPPVLAVNTGLTVNANAAVTAITTAMLNTTDGNNTAAQLVYTLTEIPADGVLKNGTTVLTANSTFTQADIDAGNISYAPSVNPSGMGGSFTFTLSDGLGGTIAATTFNITVNIFSTAMNYAAGAWPQSVTSADFNGDGNPDMAVANPGGNVSVLLGDGLGGFSSAVNFATGSASVSVTTADFNGDGKMDIAVANSSSNNVSVLLGDGLGGFSAPVNFAAGTYPQSVTSADFNGDGNADLAVANQNSNNVSVLLGDGLGGFSAAVNFAAGTLPQSVTTADFNGDGNADIAVADAGSRNVSVLLGDGAGGFSAAVNFAAGASPYSVTTADFNGDGKADLAVANQGGNVSILLGDGLGGFASAVNFAAGTSPYSVTSADFNGDGNADLAVANVNSSDISVLLNLTTVNPAANSAPLFTGTPVIAPITAGVGTRLTVSGVAATDANGNAVTLSYQWQANGVNISGATAPAYTTQAADFGKDISVVITANDGTQTANAITTAATTAAITIFNGLPTLVKNAGLTVNANAGATIITNAMLQTTDVDNTVAQLTYTLTAVTTDGMLKKGATTLILNSTFTQADIDAGNISYTPTMVNQMHADSFTFTLSDSTGGTVAATTFNITVNIFATAVSFAAGGQPASVTSADFNGDGNADMAVANQSSNDVSVLLGDGLGGFSAAVNFAAGTRPVSVTSADFNGDGNPDLAVANMGTVPHFTDSNVSVLLGDGLGGFGTAVNFAAGTRFSSVTSADFNGDGNADMAVANWGGNVSVLLGDGLGGFATAVNFAAGSRPQSVTSVDFNGDGKVDMAVANSGGNVSVLLGDGLGGFASAVNYAAGTSPSSVTSADFNGDGKVDLAVANQNSNNVSIFLGDGLGGFATAVNFAAGAFPISVTSADFNGDGKVDLAVANANSNNVSVLLGDGAGGFASAVNFAAGTVTVSVASADFDGDGNADMAVANVGGNVSVLLNLTTVNPATNTAPHFTGTPAIVKIAIGIDTRLIVTGIGTLDANGNAVSLSYQWQANGVNIAGATARTYTVQAGDFGKAITVVITANDGTHTANATGAATTAPVTIALSALLSLTTTTADGSYKAGTAVNITAHYDAPPSAGSTLTVSLNSGATGVILNTIAGNTIAGTYTVSAGENSPDLTVTAITAQNVSDAAGNTLTSTTLPTTNITAGSAIVIDTVAPTITAHNPLSNATNVAVNAAIDITFSEPVTNVTTSTFTVTPSGGSAIAGMVNHNSGNNESFSPPNNLANNTTYTVAATTGITDSAGNVITATTWSFTTTAVGALYSNGANWNDYVDNDGADVYSATDTACPATGAGYYSCIHGGEKRVVPVPGKTVCTNLTATDSLGAFDWICDASANPVRMVSTGLKDGKNLSDLVNFTTPGWLANSVTVKDGATTLFTTASAGWWGNPVTLGNFGGNLATAGTVYLVTANPSTPFTIGASKVALVIKPGITITGSATANENIISANTPNFLWVEGAIDATGDRYGVYWTTVKFSVLRNLSASNANSTGYGVYLLGASNSLSNITASNNGTGVLLARALNSAGPSYNSLSNITATNNGAYGIYLFGSSKNSLSNITASNNGNSGVCLFTASNSNSLSNITATNNTNTGVFFESAKSGRGAGSPSHNSLSNITASNNGQYGVYLIGSSNNSLSNITSTNNGTYGVYMTRFVYSSLGSMSQSFAVYSNSNFFTGLLKVGNNGADATADCVVFGGTSPGLIDTTCTDTGTNGSSAYTGQLSNATLTTGVTLANSFIGKAVIDDAVNISDTNGTATFPANPTTFDWSSFENSYRGWGKDGIAFPDATNRGRWTSGTGRIWDWSLSLADSIVRAILPVTLTGSAANSIKHKWAGTAADQAACTALVAGSAWDSATNTCSTTYLRNASEISGDGIGNDNGLCESNETCLYTPNIGSYQGHGALISAGTFIDGAAITGVTLMRYTTNGY